MSAQELIKDLEGLENSEKIDILEAVIKGMKEKLELLTDEQNRIYKEVGVGFKTSLGSIVTLKSRKSTSIDAEMFWLTDKDKYLEFAQEGKLTVPASCIKTLDQNSPYITTKVSEWYTLKESE